MVHLDSPDHSTEEQEVEGEMEGENKEGEDCEVEGEAPKSIQEKLSLKDKLKAANLTGEN